MLSLSVERHSYFEAVVIMSGKLDPERILLEMSLTDEEEMSCTLGMNTEYI